MRRPAWRIVRGAYGRPRPKRNRAANHENLRETEVRRFYSNDCRTRRIGAKPSRISLAPCRSFLTDRQKGAADWRWCSLRGRPARRSADAATLAAVYDAGLVRANRERSELERARRFQGQRQSRY